MSVHYDVIRRLTTQYQQGSRKEVTFGLVLKRVDKLLMCLMRICSRRMYSVNKVEPNDLYHTAVMAVGEALSRAKPEEDGQAIITRITKTVARRLRSVYKYGSKRCGVGLGFREEVEGRSFDHDLVLDVETILKGFTPEELELIHMRFSYCYTMREIGDKCGCPIPTVQYRINKLLKKLAKVAEDYKPIPRRRRWKKKKD